MAARGIACCSKCGTSGRIVMQVPAFELPACSRVTSKPEVGPGQKSASRRSLLVSSKPVSGQPVNSGLSPDTSAFVRAHLAYFVKRRERAYYSHRAFTTCAASSWESEELDERPHALFLKASRKSLGSC